MGGDFVFILHNMWFVLFDFCHLKVEGTKSMSVGSLDGSLALMTLAQPKPYRLYIFVLLNISHTSYQTDHKIGTYLLAFGCTAHVYTLVSPYLLQVCCSML